MHKLLPYTAMLMITLGASACTEVPDPEATEPTMPKLSFKAGNALVLPEDYREWIYVSSGLGMSYSDAPPGEDPPFGNVFVHPAAYRAFTKTGAWPDQTIFVLEIRASTTHGSIVKNGRFQQDLIAVEAEVKDKARFKEQWAYFGFRNPDGTQATTATAHPKEDCFSCHDTNAAVENTFVQFYPTLLEVAERKGTINSDYTE